MSFLPLLILLLRSLFGSAKGAPKPIPLNCGKAGPRIEPVEQLQTSHEGEGKDTRSTWHANDANFNASFANLPHVIHSTWEDHMVLGTNNVTVLSSSPGTWNSNVSQQTGGCATPRFWLFLAGQYRSFRHNTQTFLTSAQITAPGCFMIVALVEENINVPDPKPHRSDWRDEANRI